MPKHTPSTRLVAAVLASGALAGGAAGAAQAAVDAPGRDARTTIDMAPSSSSGFSHPTRITNPWLPLSVHREAVFTGRSETGAELRVVQTVPRHISTFVVEGRLVRATAVEQRTFEGGRLTEMRVSYYAQADDGTVFELGRATHDARGTDHRGSISLGRGQTETGVRLVMPAVPRDGAELVSGGARVIDTNARLTVAGGTFARVLVVHTPATADDASEVRYYARGVGLVKARTATGALELANLR